MTATLEVLELLQEIAAVQGVRGVMLATADGPVGAAEHAHHLAPAVASDLVKTVRRLAVASSTANAPLRELLINFGPSRMMLRPLGEDVLVVLLEREIDTSPIRALLDLEVKRMLRVLNGEANEPIAAFGLDDGDDIGRLLASPLGPILREIEAVYHTHRAPSGFDQTQTRSIMHDQIREWLLCCNPSNYTLPLLLDGLSETMLDDPGNRNRFVGEAQGILRKSGALR